MTDFFAFRDGFFFDGSQPIHPCTDGRLFALDAKMNFDDNAPCFGIRPASCDTTRKIHSRSRPRSSLNYQVDGSKVAW